MRLVSTAKPASWAVKSFAQMKAKRFRTTLCRAFLIRSSVSAANPTLTKVSGSSSRKSAFSINSRISFWPCFFHLVRCRMSAPEVGDRGSHQDGIGGSTGCEDSLPHFCDSFHMARRVVSIGLAGGTVVIRVVRAPRS